MLNLNKVQSIQRSHLFGSDVIGKNAIDRTVNIFEDYHTEELSQTSLKSKVKLNLGIAYFAALSVMLFLLFS